MSIVDYISERGIEEVVHFTTNSGLTGIVAQEAIKCRKLLKDDKHLEHIYKQSCPDRDRDSAWHGYVNLSITRINARLFNIAAGNWHYGLDGWWCILGISPEILDHDGVYFTTTNNIYPAVKRACGLAGLQAMFSPTVAGIYSRPVPRYPGQSDAETTCVQAEVLYPGQVPLSFVRKIYLRDAEHVDAALAMMATFQVNPIECIVDHSRFQP